MVASVSVYEQAMLYYPRLWNKDRIKALVRAGRLTEEEAERIYSLKGESK